MFTGLIETVGTLTSTRPSGQGRILSIDLGKLADKAKLGDSIAVNGVCLTVSRLAGSIGDFDLSGETLSKTIISDLRPGAKVNLEPALAANGLLGGHIVQGHVDGIASIKSITNKGQFYDLSIACSTELLKGIVLKGSVAVNGISLTIADISLECFSIAVIPVTWKETNLSTAKVGDKVNIETDILVKIISQQLKNMLGDNTSGKLTLDKLRSLGF